MNDFGPSAYDLCVELYGECSCWASNRTPCAEMERLADEGCTAADEGCTADDEGCTADDERQRMEQEREEAGNEVDW